MSSETSMQTFNVAALMKDNPLTKLSSDYGSKFLEKIMTNFSPEEQNIYIANMYGYLNYKPTDYVINLDNIWKMIGFGKKGDCKSLLVNNFEKNKHYTIMSQQEYDNIIIDNPILKAASVGAEAGIINKNLDGSGLNKEIILITVYCFKKLCLKAKTKKSDEIHEYYIKLEDMINELVIEQAEELRIKLQNKDKEIDDKNKEIDDKNKKIMNDSVITLSD